MTLVSVVIPTYNSRDFIAETLQSVRDTGFADMEIIVTDDGSTDGTADTIAAMPDVRLIRQANQGDSAARNTGLAQATGTYVLFLDHDDVLLPEAIVRHVAAIEQSSSYEIVIGSNLLINSRGQEIGANQLQPRAVSSRDVALGMTPSFSQCLYRRAALERIGGFRPSATVAADHDLNLRLLGREGRGFVHGEMVMKYRLHEGQQTKSPARLYRVHMDALAHLLGPGGELEDAALLEEALTYWQDYYGKFLPSEVARMVRLGKMDKAVSAAELFLRIGRRSVPSALRYWGARIRDRLAPGGQAAAQHG